MKLLIKWIYNFSIIYLSGIYFADAGQPFWTAVLVSAAFVPLAYLGDLFYMTRYGNFQTALLEGFGIFGLLMLVQSVSTAPVSVGWGITAGVLILIFEIVLHRWIIYQRTCSRV